MPRDPLYGFRKAFCQYLLPAIFAVAKEPAHAQFDPHRKPLPGQITQPSPVAAVMRRDSPRHSGQWLASPVLEAP